MCVLQLSGDHSVTEYFSQNGSKAPFLYQGGIKVDNPKETKPNVYVNAVSASCQGSVNYFYKSKPLSSTVERITGEVSILTKE